jgi:hypothetical protein
VPKSPGLLRVESARDLGPQFVDNPHRMVGQDGAYSIPLGDGSALWYFGDTLVGQRPDKSLHEIFREPMDGKVVTGNGPFQQMITNTGLVLRNETGADGLNKFCYILDDDGRLKQLVPSLPSENPELQRVWCMHGIKIDDTIYLYYMLVLMHEVMGGHADMGFEILGTGLAEGNRRNWDFRRIAHNGETLWWSVEQPQFGAIAFYDEPTGYVFLYGSMQDPDSVHHAYLARVPPREIANLPSHEYFSGDPNDWSSDERHAVSLFSGQPNEMSVSYNLYLRKYLAVHSLGLSGDLVGRTAEKPWGPWSSPTVLWTVAPFDATAYPPRSFYAGKEHPEIARDGGRVLYLTYIDSNEYFPHLIEVALA